AARGNPPLTPTRFGREIAATQRPRPRASSIAHALRRARPVRILRGIERPEEANAGVGSETREGISLAGTADRAPAIILARTAAPSRRRLAHYSRYKNLPI